MNHDMEARSELVSVVAWMLIVGSCFGLFVALFQAVYLGVVWRYSALPLSFGEQFGPYPVVVVLFALLSLVMLVAGIGLRRRYNWARALTVLLCYLGVLLGIALFALYYFGINAMMPMAPSPDEASLFAAFATIFKAFMASFTVAVCALLLWVANRLSSMHIINEFRPRPVVRQVPDLPRQETEDPSNTGY